MSRLMLQSDLVAAMSHESQRDLRALTDANNKVPSDIARSMGADATLIQVSLASFTIQFSLAKEVLQMRWTLGSMPCSTGFEIMAML